MKYIFVYSVIYIKCDFSKIKLKSPCDSFVLIGSEYCLSKLDEKNRTVFDEIHQISRDFQQIDANEVEQIVKKYVELEGSENIRLLTNEDSAQIGCARLREIYDIPGNRVDQLLPFVHKVISKNRLGNTVHLPRFIPFEKNSYANNKSDYLDSIVKKIAFPMFVKPVDLVSSVETHRVDNLSELQLIAEKISEHEYEFEVDEFIEGDLFHCDALVIGQEIKFFMVGKCSFPLARFFDGKPVGSIPTENSDDFERLKSLCKSVLKKLNAHDGAYHLEAFLENKSQQFVFLEIGARTGGALITKVYEKIYGINIEEVNYLIQMGCITDVCIKPTKLVAGFLNFPHVKGIVQSINRPELDISSEFIEFVNVSDELDRAKNLLDIACSIIFWDVSHSTVEQTFEYLKNYTPLTMIHNA